LSFGGFGLLLLLAERNPTFPLILKLSEKSPLTAKNLREGGIACLCVAPVCVRARTGRRRHIWKGRILLDYFGP